MKEWYSFIYKAFVYASIISFIIGFFTSASASLGAYIAGYVVLILGILMVLVILLANLLQNTHNTTLQLGFSIFTTAGPFILILGVISFMLYLLIHYKAKIIAGHVAQPGYSTFSNIIILLTLLQLYLIHGAINTIPIHFDNLTTSTSTWKLPRVTASILYLLGVLTTISSIILYTILRYYSTDGFTSSIQPSPSISKIQF